MEAFNERYRINKEFLNDIVLMKNF